MRRFWFLPAVLGVTGALLAQSSAPSDKSVTDDRASAPCTVTGRVLTAADGNPLKSARISLIPEHTQSHSQLYAGSSDNDGLFTLKGIPPGRYRFSAAHTGFVEQHYKAGTDDTGPLFSLRPGEKVNDILFRLIAAAVITGRVSNEDGDPMQRLEVVALRRPSEEEIEDVDTPRMHKIQMDSVGSAETDDRGQYRIFGLNPGEYFVRAADSFLPPGGSVAVDETFWLKQSLGSEYASVYYPGVTQVSQAQLVPIKAGEEAHADITIRRVKTVEVVGKVIGATGPAASASVNLNTADVDESDFDRQDTTDEKGNFRLRNVPEGTYYIRVYQRQEGARTYESRARQKLEVSGDDIDALTISLTAGVAIQGRVKVPTSLGLDKVGLALLPVVENEFSGGHSKVKKDGTFEFNSVPDGSYAIAVWGLDRDAYVKSARRGPDDLLEKGLQVDGNSSGKIDVTVSSDGAQLEGSVSDDDGGVIGARVRLVPDPLTPYNHLRIQRTTTDQLGRFTLTDIAPGKYKLTAKPMVSSETDEYQSEPQAITFSENDHKTTQVKLEKQPQE
jgi:protocatechuate 3,4-dioxygenase beta subunit